MKRFFDRYHLQIFSVLTIATILLCAWQSPWQKSTNKHPKISPARDTLPQQNQDVIGNNIIDMDKILQELDNNKAVLDEQMKGLHANIHKALADSISKINMDEILEQTKASLQKIDWDKIKTDADQSIQQAQTEIAKIDFTKLRDQMNDLQKKLQSKEFTEQLDTEKWQKKIDDAMSKAKEGIEKAKTRLQEINDFTNALAADHLIDKKKGFTIEWKKGDLFINGREQPKNISDKYRKYESSGTIKMSPDGAERF
jgi:hypothetical protein